MDTPIPVPATINYDDFSKLELRVATVLECKPHANADKLLVPQIDLGGEKRQICAGLRQHIIDPQTLVGRQIVVVANLAPRQMRGEISQCNAPCRHRCGNGPQVIIVTPSEAVGAGIESQLNKLSSMAADAQRASHLQPGGDHAMFAWNFIRD